MVPNLLTKQLLKLFGFPFHTAPGEAEAECALLQREGIVDAVLSEDVDTLMFGCGTTLRNWSSEGVRGNKSPTHVNVYDAKQTKDTAGLDREGMILIALMSGGDYIPEGIPGCGIKIACEAARAGYGKKLCQISRSDTQAYIRWRDDLTHEMHTNASKHFRMKHKSLVIPEDFPNKEVLDLYTHPIVSSASKIESLKEEIIWDVGVDVQGLRIFVADAFEWTHKVGAIKFIRGLAPVLLVHKLLLRANRRASGYGDVVLTAINEMEYVRSICGQRTHFSTDGMSELRVAYMPNDIVGLNLEAELDDSDDIGRDGLAPINDDDQIEAFVDNIEGNRGVSQYDPTQLHKIWISHTVAKMGIPLKVEDYEESLRAPKRTSKLNAAPKTTAATRKTRAKNIMPQGALDRFVQVSKPASQPTVLFKESTSNTSLPPAFLAPLLARSLSPDLPTSRPIQLSRGSIMSQFGKTTGVGSSSKRESIKSRTKKVTHSTSSLSNPWTMSRSQAVTPPRITKAMTQQAKPDIIDLLSSSPEPTMPPVHVPAHSPAQQSPQAASAHQISPTFPRNIRSSSPADTSSSPPTTSSPLAPLPSTVTRTRGTRQISIHESVLTPTTPSSSSPTCRKRGSAEVEESRKRTDSVLFSSPTSRILSFEKASEAEGGSNAALEHDIEEVEKQELECSLAEPDGSYATASFPTSRLEDQEHEDKGSDDDAADCSLPDITTFSTFNPPQSQSKLIHLSTSPPLFSSKPPQPNYPHNTTDTHRVDTIKSTHSSSPPSKKSTEKTYLMLRESIGGFQELNEEEWQSRSRITNTKITSSSSQGEKQGSSGKVEGSPISKPAVNMSMRGDKIREKNKGRQRKVFRISQVEVLDLSQE